MAKSPRAFFWTGAHSFHRILYHLVFTPKYRRRVLRTELVYRLRTLIVECSKANKWFIHEFEVLPDHIHLLIQLPATISISKAVHYLKGGTSRILRKEFPELEEFLWGDSFWQDGYYVETVGRKDEKSVRSYLQEQWNPGHK